MDTFIGLQGIFLMHSIYIGESSLDDRSAQVFPYNIFTYCSICRVDCKFAKKKNIVHDATMDTFIGLQGIIVEVRSLHNHCCETLNRKSLREYKSTEP
jgi:hypothetical protein